ncbi:hypothetical protein VTL71DRAFT_9469 [Oculimacula yallundae]|uniref:Uncharacterized protein n=1 Tax=Oculimacula yallundae TaxID=86028 RepID=A0ABR4BS36_9HELO
MSIPILPATHQENHLIFPRYPHQLHHPPPTDKTTVSSNNIRAERPTRVTVAHELISIPGVPIVGQGPRKPKIQQSVSAARIFKKQAKPDLRSKKLKSISNLQSLKK